MLDLWPFGFERDKEMPISENFVGRRGFWRLLNWVTIHLSAFQLPKFCFYCTLSHSVSPCGLIPWQRMHTQRWYSTCQLCHSSWSFFFFLGKLTYKHLVVGSLFKKMIGIIKITHYCKVCLHVASYLILTKNTGKLARYLTVKQTEIQRY